MKMGGESVGIMANILSGAFWPCVPAHGLPVVDVEDVVAAHSLAAVSPKARGRRALSKPPSLSGPDSSS